MAATERAPLLEKNHGDQPTKTSSLSVFHGLVRPAIAEFIGTAMLVFIGTLSRQNELFLAVGISTGLGYAMLVFSFGQFSGGHFNPAVTLGVFLSGGIPFVLAIIYFCVQVLGSILGAALTRGVLSINGVLKFLPPQDTSIYEQIQGGAGILHGYPDYNPTPAAGILNEAVFSFVLVSVVIMMTVDSKTKSPSAGLPMGLAVTVSTICGGPVSGSMLNPVRALGPCMVITDVRSDVWIDHYVFWVGPLIGALVAALVYRLVFADEDRRLWFKAETVRAK